MVLQELGRNCQVLREFFLAEALGLDMFISSQGFCALDPGPSPS